MKRLVFLGFVFLAIWAWRYQPPARWRGMPAAKDPVQTAAPLPARFTAGDYTVTPLANYSITAVVLGRERYRFDPSAKLSPVDLALGWGPMSVAGTINELRISQGGRFYEYRWSDEPPLEVEQIVCHSANTHCLPADDHVRKDLLAVRRHELVSLTGYLVQVTNAQGWIWRSSLTRDDSGGGACEVLWVTGVSHRKL
ncbi:hypothetical protein DB347_04870 [Opitutaceae bacterium EW11]|nr:hypothetical protein DB347_04870 [Opitutaceae bacterium EW11]